VSAEKNQIGKILVSFTLLFILYHSAEYMIVFSNSIPGFFGFQLLFFVVAFICGNWYSKNGLNAWHLPFKKENLPHVLVGIIAGCVLYGVPYCFSLLTGNEKIVAVPNWKDAMAASIPFTFGVIFSSFSEDILTRGVVFTFLKKKVQPTLIVLISSAIYLLNHIYRLGDGIESLLYLFLLGIIFAIPLMFTNNLWLTGSMHWAGNTFFYITHNVIETEYKNQYISSNYLFSLFLLLFIPLVWQLSKKIKKAMDHSQPKPLLSKTFSV
jgi:membrane protease YdiL (CAAX protease family)